MKASLLLRLCAAAFIATPVLAQEDAEIRKHVQELDRDDDKEPARDKKLERVKAEIDELRKVGRHEEAERLTKRMREAMPKSFKEDRKENPDAERRDHLMAAIKHLHAADQHEQAQHLEQMLHEMDARRAQGDGAPQMEQAMRKMQEQMERTVREMQERTERAMKEKHAQMEKMARTIDELREQLARPRGESERRKD